jgi:HNH endonuclease
MPSRFKTGTTCKTTKRYPRVTAGPLRHKYIHRIVAAALIGRELHKDEEVHHKDGDRRNFNWDNLLVLGSKDHGWVSLKQSWYMRSKDIKLKRQWDEFMESEERRFDDEVASAKIAGVLWNARDGKMRQRFEGHGSPRVLSHGVV